MQLQNRGKLFLCQILILPQITNVHSIHNITRDYYGLRECPLLTFKGYSLKIWAAGGDSMADYKKMYLVLFNAITDALEELEAQRPVSAAERLIRAQRCTEALYMDANQANE